MGMWESEGITGDWPWIHTGSVNQERPESICTVVGVIRSFVRYYVQGCSLLWTPVLRPSVGPMR